ncbi:MAG: flavin-containing monooxygenase [Alphaproteobacteria bacterium]
MSGAQSLAVHPSLETAVSSWISGFGAAMAAGDEAQISQLLNVDSHWRDIVVLTWSIRTHSGGNVVAAALAAAAKKEKPSDFRLADGYSAPRIVERAGTRCIEAFYQFETVAGRGIGVVRLTPPALEAPPKAWTLMTSLQGLNDGIGFAPDDRPDVGADIDAPNWLDLRQASSSYREHDPDVLIVGGGHAGCTTAAELGRLGVDALVVDREKRVGDNWRLRYHSLKLHNRTPINHFPMLPFPDTFPAYIPKDKLANWIEFYVDAMEINFWTETTFEGAEYDARDGRWTARLTQVGGETRTVRPKHIVMATSVSGTPSIPEIPTLDRFNGDVVHSSSFTNGAKWQGRPAMVIGTGTSAHDIAQNLHAHGADVTMVQRSPTMVINVDPSAQLYDGLYLGDGPPLAERDLINSSMPMPVVKRAHQMVTQQVRDIDAELLAGLEAAGFQLEFGEDGAGWPLKYRQRGGGYYFNAGCSDLIAAGDIRVIQYADIEAFTVDGAALRSGDRHAADIIVLATGYMGQDYLLKGLFGDAVAKAVGQVWGVNSETSELNNMWTPTGQSGLWFTAGSLSQCRIYSKYLAMQIKAAG